MSSAEIVPIALVLDERTGYTLWAPPWEEDGEQWQAFLGKDDKILLFDSPAQLAQFLRDEDDHDLNDHPDWDEWEDVDAFDVVPDNDSTFDLDGVYELVLSRPDRWSVGDLGRTLAIVDAIAQCCDEDIVKPVEGTSELSMVSDGLNAFTGRSGDRAWDNIALGISAHWEDVCERVAQWIDWREPVELDDDLADAQKEIDATALPVDDPDALIDAEDAAREEDEENDYLEERDERERADLGEDEDADDDDESDEDDADADDDDTDDDDADDDDTESDDDTDEEDLDYQPLAGSAPDDEIDAESAYEFWEDSGILPVRITLPEKDFDETEAFTLRCYVDDRPIFMGANQAPWLFRSPDAMLDVVEDDDQNDIEKPGHDLRNLATWPTVVGAVRDDDMPLAIAGQDDVDLEQVDRMVRGELDLNAEAFTAAADLLADLAEYGELDGSSSLLEGDGALGTLVAAARDGEDTVIDDPDALIGEWEAVLREVASIIEWAD
ncbi:MAG: hypothetical protein ACK5MR_03770 [Cumulibacter sp.]